MKKSSTILGAFFVFATSTSPSLSMAAQTTLTSPDHNIRLKIDTENQLRLSISHKQQPIVNHSEISLLVSHLGKDFYLGKQANCEVIGPVQYNKKIQPVIAHKRAMIPDQYNELTLNCHNQFSVKFRAYNDGVAYRFITYFKDSIYIKHEDINFQFADNYLTYFPTENSFITHSERFYEQLYLQDIDRGQMASLPLVVDVNGIKVAILEADLYDYPGLYLTGNGDALRLTGKLPHYPKEEAWVSDRTLDVTSRHDYLAKTDGTRAFPWRVLLIAKTDTDLVDSDMVYKLAKKNSNYSDDYWDWVDPGLVMWDWWHNFIIPDVPFKSGLNTATYKHYIDFAKRHGLKYVIFDEGWSKPSDLFAINPDMDMTFLTRYAQQQGVGIILWSLWNTLEQQEHAAFQQFVKWGIKGIKIDFMQRDDQKMVNYYWKMAEKAAKHRLLINYHGSYKPTGIRRSYPNILTREGVAGLEQLKGNHRPDPEHNVTIPYLRMIAGPMDYTPGAMNTFGYHEKHLHTTDNRRQNLPSGLGTRAHQLAMYVIYESPLQMLADSPANYRKERKSLDFITQIPVVWEQTVMLDGKLGDYIAIARQQEAHWFIGAMTDWTPRQLKLDLSFLEKGCYTLKAIADTDNSINDGNDFRIYETTVKGNDSIAISLAPGGGWVARLTETSC